MTWTARRSRPTRLAVAGVLALHALGLAGLLQLGVWRDRTPPAPVPAPLTVRLIQALTLDRPARAPAATPDRTRPTAPAPRRQRDAEAITLTAPAPAGAATPLVEAPPPVAAAPPAAASAAALDLRLPRAASAPWRARSPALDDPRANSARASFEARLQGAMGGDGRWVEERIDADRVRFRRGDTCVDLKRSQAERLDPWNQTNSPKPWVTDGPQRC